MEQFVVGGVVDLLLTLALGLGVSALVWMAYLYASKIKDEKLRGMVLTFVQAAEQLYKDEAGQTKLDWVFGELRKLFPRLDAGLLRAMIEQAVLSIRLYAAQQEPPAPVQVVIDKGTWAPSGTYVSATGSGPIPPQEMGPPGAAGGGRHRGQRQDVRQEPPAG